MMDTSNNDLESNKLKPLKSILVKPDKEKNTYIKETIANAVWMFIILVFILPTTFCDYYFAENNKVCTQQKVYISLTMYDYLMTNAIISTIIGFSAIVVFMCSNLNKIHDKNDDCFYHIFGMLFRGFNISWCFVGCIMYWGEMDRTVCSSQVNDYLTAVLIIRIVAIALDLNNNR